MKDIKNLNTKTILITGGTGSFGKAFLNLALNHTDVEEIRIFSRDEKKQDDMRNTFKDERLRFYIGDVRDIQSLKDALHGTDYVFHAAALKQVPACEIFPLEAVRTNVLGTENVLQASIDLNIDLKRSILIGDRETDLEAGFRADIPRVFHVLTGHGKKERKGILDKSCNRNVITREVNYGKIICLDTLKDFPFDKI